VTEEEQYCRLAIQKIDEEAAIAKKPYIDRLVNLYKCNPKPMLIDLKSFNAFTTAAPLDTEQGE
jgi:hypothetical protein